jgi:hypothetical protein
LSRIRNIKPETFDDPDLNALPPLARWLFVGLWTEADRDGRMEDDPRRISVRLLPYDTGNFPAGTTNCDDVLALLAPRFITRYAVDGRNYIQVNNFTKHQRFHKDEKSMGFPSPNGKSSGQPGNFPVKSPCICNLKSEIGKGETEAAPPPTLTRPKPLGYRGRIDVAWPGRPPVPGSLHEEFVSKLGGDPEDARRRLGEWYPKASAEYDNQPIGDDDFKFWQARFREWVGTTVKPVKAGPPEPTEDEIWESMQARKALRKRT